MKDVLTNHNWEEKVNQIRIYSGQKFEAVNEIKGRFYMCSNRTQPNQAGRRLRDRGSFWHTGIGTRTVLLDYISGRR